MPRNPKSKITMSLLVAAGATVVVALCLAGVRKKTYKPVQAPQPEPVPVVIKPVVKPEPAPVKPEPEPEPKPPKPVEPPKVDVVFVLDTTGSMSGLIAGAKRKIWSIANQIISGDPQPHVRVGLIGYRDLGDDYVTRRYQLTEEIDDVYARLRRFKAGGGGDTPEHVNRALAEAIRKMQWRKGQNVLRQIYLVGDAPPHEGRDGLYSKKLARQAARKGIVINAVRCGSMGPTAVAWRKIASATGGQYASIRQDGAMMAMSTPMDRRLSKLNAELTSTLLPTGGADEKKAARRRARDNSKMDALAQAESAKYRASSGRLDGRDLLTVLGRGKKLADLSEEELPAPLAAMPSSAREGYVAQVKAKRAKLRKQIAELSKKRDAYLKTKRPAKAPTSFDDTIGKALKAQGTRAGLAY